MPGRPKPQKRLGGTARLLSEVVADNVRAYRTLRRTSQEALAGRMVSLGHSQWTRAAVSEVERHGRQLVIDELLALALILEKSVPELLDPAGPGAEGKAGAVDLGATELDRWSASAIVRDVGRPDVIWPEKAGGVLQVRVEPKSGRDHDVLRAQLADVRDARQDGKS